MNKIFQPYRQLGLLLFFIFQLKISLAHKHEETVQQHNTTGFEFVENKGQFHPNVKYKANINSGALFLESNQWSYHFYDAGLLSALHTGTSDENLDFDHPEMRHHAYRVLFLNSNNSVELEADEVQPHFYNFFRGNDPNKWASQVNAFKHVRYKELYNRINLELYTTEDHLKYDWVVAPGGDPTAIQWQYEGVDELYLKRGRLHITTSLNENWEEAPYAYQIINGKQVEVKCAYVLTEENTVTFEFPNGYDSSLPLIIDPTLIFSTYSGSTTNNFGYTSSFDALGFLYAGSTSFGVSYPTTTGAYQTTWGGGDGYNSGTNFEGTDVAITKYDTSGTFMIYSTYLGGSGDEIPHSLIVNENNELYVMGTTGSSNFPTTIGAYDQTFSSNSAQSVSLLNGLGVYYPNSCDVFVTKFNANGTALEGSTYLGGSSKDGLNLGVNLKYNYADEVRGEIEIDNLGNIYVVSSTYSQNFPTTSNVIQPTKPGSATNQDGFITKLTPDLTNIIWSSFFGGTGGEAIYAVSVDENNEIYISGGTNSSDLPITPGTLDTAAIGGVDAFVSHISSDGSTVNHSTYYGSTAYDQSYFVELDNQSNVYIFGQTEASGSTLIYNATYNVPNSGQFIAKMSPELDSLIWSTVFGSGDGDPDISPTAFLVDLCSAVYLSGWGSAIQSGSLSTQGLPVTSNAYQSTTDNNDFYLMVLADDASQLTYGSYFGGSSAEHVDGGTSRFDKKGKMYQSVCASCGSSANDFPTYPNPGAVSNVNGATGIGGCNSASFKMDFNLPIVLADFIAPEAGCAPISVTFDNLSLEQSATTFYWDFGDGSTSTQFEPSHTYTGSGTFEIMLIVSDTGSCNLSDTLIKEISILKDTNYSVNDAFLCQGASTQIGITNNSNPNVNYTWIPSSFLSDTTVANPVASPPQNQLYTLIIDNGVCADTIQQNVIIDSVSVTGFADSAVCSSEGPTNLLASSSSGGLSYIWSTNNSYSDTLNTSTNDSVASVIPQDSISTFYIQVINTSGCLAEDSVQILVLDLDEPLIADFASPTVACAPVTLNFLNTTQALSSTHYIWELPNGDTTSTISSSYTFTSGGVYQVSLIAIDTAVCAQYDTLSLDITIDENQTYTLNFTACLNQETTIGITPDSNTTYSWTPATLVSDPTLANPTISIASDTSLLLIVDDGVCIDSVTNTVAVDEIYALTDNVIITCSDELPLIFSGTSLGTADTFVWSGNAAFTDTLNTNLTDSSYSYFGTGATDTLWFAATTSIGCTETAPLTLVISDLTIQASPDEIICAEDSVTLSATNSYPANIQSYSWEPTASILSDPTAQSVNVSPDVSTSYIVTAVNDSGCVATDTVDVTVSGLTGNAVLAYADDDTVILGFSTQLYADPNGNYNYSWEPLDGLSHPNSNQTTASPTQTTDYTVTVSDPATGCNYKRTVHIEVVEIICGEPEIFVPSAFTPDGDGQNDVLYVRGKNVKDLEFNIYNRWGEKVFESSNQQRGWDGVYNNQLVDQAVFVYYLDVTCIDGQKYFKKGDVTVIR
tara:strand:+ start:1477 stop:6072 length:4596 start_codon:yes stop_codon:yes gene_type:complete